MSEYWKSTPKYWCKHCSTYVRDTKLERTNHEATGKHQSAIKRSLRDLHRNAEQQEREKERARREVERLNGVVSGSSSSRSQSQSQSTSKPTAALPPPRQLTEAERQKQLEQLAELGVSIPTELRGNMAMAGEWTVTSRRVISESQPGDPDTKDGGKEEPDTKDEARAMGVKRRRERTEEEKEQDEAIRGLFVKRKKWGVDSKRVPTEEDAELDALLSGPLALGKVKKEEEIPVRTKQEEEEEAGQQGQDATRDGEGDGSQVNGPAVKIEPGEGEERKASLENTPTAAAAAVKEEVGSAVVFKKRRPKNIRQK